SMATPSVFFQVTFTFNGQQTTAPTSGGAASVTLSALTQPGESAVTASAGDASGQASITFVAGVAGEPASVTLTCDPVEIQALAGVTFAARATVNDADGNAVPDGTEVAFTVADQQVSGTTTGGIASVTLNAVTSAGDQTVTAVAGGASGTASVTFVPGAATTITVTCDPVEVIAIGDSTFTARASVTDASGNPAADGTQVTFSFGGQEITAQTTDGFAEVSIAAGDPGAGTVTATTGGTSGSAVVTVVPGPPAAVTVTCNPAEVLAKDGNTFQAIAVVEDEEGNAVADGIEVTFSFNGQNTSAATSNGGAGATLSALTEPGGSTVTATAGGISGNGIAGSVGNLELHLDLKALRTFFLFG
ncbi:Ig-like domain-containing protein, partial [Planctomycetota bacterium]